MSKEAIMKAAVPYEVRGPPGYGNHAISFTVSSSDTSPREWPARLEKIGFILDCAEWATVYREGFEPSFGVITKVVILPGILFKDENRTLPMIYDKAYQLGLEELNLEAVYLTMERIAKCNSLMEMGLLGIIGMHNPVGNSCRRHFYNDGAWRLKSLRIIDSHRLHSRIGFAFQAIRVHVGPTL